MNFIAFILSAAFILIKDLGMTACPHIICGIYLVGASEGYPVAA
jgi:hypothetical protein